MSLSAEVSVSSLARVEPISDVPWINLPQALLFPGIPGKSPCCVAFQLCLSCIHSTTHSVNTSEHRKPLGKTQVLKK